MAMDTSSVPTADDISQAGPGGADVDQALADVDLVIERADLGEGCTTFIAAGDRIPPHLAGLPRTPRGKPGKAARR